MRRIGQRFGTLLLALAAGGCAVVAPLYDRRMSDAPRQACAALAEPATEAAPSCFALFEADETGQRAAWSGGMLRPGRILLAIHQPAAPGCGGRFTHLVVTGATDGAGRAELATWDPLGRPGHARTLPWARAERVETLVLPSIDAVAMAPGGARLSVVEGSFAPASLCFKSY